MLRVTVAWHPGAESDVAELYRSSSERRRFRDAVNEADSLLRVDPGKKGQAWFAGQLPTMTLDVLKDRKGVIPEDIRVMQLGPIAVYFECFPLDCLVNVWHVRLRS